MPPTTPEPIRVLRTLTAQITALSFSNDNEYLYAADIKGWVTITSTRTMRPIAMWNAHEGGVLTVEEWHIDAENGHSVITHGRDNKLHIWSLLSTKHYTHTIGDSAAGPVSDDSPKLQFSLDVNALNFCRFSLLRSSTQSKYTALVAIPNLVDSSLADVWELPSGSRMHAAIGKEGKEGVTIPFSNGRGGAGIIMALHLFSAPHPSSTEQQLQLLTAYEDGSIALRVFTSGDRKTSVEGIGWTKLWSHKLHAESIMAMSVSRDASLALTVSADHLIGRYDLKNLSDGNISLAITHRTKHPGNAAIAIRGDSRVCAIAGWDGKVRLYSTKSLKPLGTLSHHKEACQALAFAHYLLPSSNTSHSTPSYEDEDSDQEMSIEEKSDRCLWLASGGKDGRVAIWPLMRFDK